MREVKTSLVESLRKKLFDDLKSNLEKEGRFLVRQDLDSALTNPIWPTSTARLKALSMFPVCAISEADKQWLATKEHREAVKTYLSNYSSTIPAEPVSLLPCITMTLPPTSQLHLKDSMTNINAVDMNATSFWVNSYYKNRKDLFVEANVRRFEVEVPQKQESVFVLVHVSKSDGLRDEKTSVVDSLLQKLFDDLETNLEEKGQYLLRQGLFSALAKPTWPSSTAQLSTSSEVPVYVISTATQKWLDTKGHKEAVKTQLRAINSTLPAELVSQLSAKA